MKRETIRLENLSIGYREKKSAKIVASRINASICGGELTCLLGANGVGKSTLLKTLSLFQPKMDGKIFLLGKEIAEYTEKELATVVGVVLTERCDIRNMSTEDLVGMGRSPYTGFWGTLNREDAAIVQQAIEQVNIRHLTGRMVHTLSDGERQKVMIAKALAQQTPVIFLDEPTAFLDFPSKVEIMQLLHGLTRKAGKTVFLSTHDLELALQIADKIWLMDKVHGFSVGTPEDLALNGDLSTFFARKGIAFDKETGLFRIEGEYARKISLAGHNVRYAMVRKALQRNGILAGRTVESEWLVEITGEEFIFRRKRPGERLGGADSAVLEAEDLSRSVPEASQISGASGTSRNSGISETSGTSEATGATRPTGPTGPSEASGTSGGNPMTAGKEIRVKTIGELLEVVIAVMPGEA